jgi:hypothetical protein
MAWHETAEFVGGGFGGLFAWDKAHAIFGSPFLQLRLAPAAKSPKAYAKVDGY